MNFQDMVMTAMQQQWVLEVFTVILATLLMRFVVGRLLGRATATAEQTENVWDDILLDTMQKPVAVAIIVIGLSYAVELAYLRTGNELFANVTMVRQVTFVMVGYWILHSFMDNLRRQVLAKGKQQQMDPATVTAMTKIAQLALLVTTGLVILQTLGISISGILTVGGIGGLAAGFAARDVLANFFGGLMIYLDRPFTEGDWVCSPDREIEGTVEKIGWRLTLIRRFDSTALYVPNSIFANISLENCTRMQNRRIYETIGVRYNDISSMDKIVDAVKTMLEQHSEIDVQRTMIVNFNAFNDSSVDFFVYTFTKTTEWVKFHQIKQDVLLKISQIIEAHGAEIAFPTTTVHIDKN